MNPQPLRLILHFLLAGMLLCSCSSVQPNAGSRAGAPLSPKAGKALVVIYRPSGGFGGIVAKHDITINGFAVASKMGRSSYVTYDSAPGAVVVSGRLDRVTTSGPAPLQSILATAPNPILLTPTSEVRLPPVHLNVMPGETRYLEIYFTMQQGGALREVPAETGAREVLKCQFHGTGGH